MKKRILATILLMILFPLLAPLSARSDGIVEPENNFFSRNRNACMVLNRDFHANGSAGYVSLRSRPGGVRESERVDNGEMLFISHVYNHRGEIWGFTDIFDFQKYEGGLLFGWVPMNQLLLAYDYVSFREDHGDEFYTFEGSPDPLLEAEEVVFWMWPGSGVYHRTIGASYKARSFDVLFGSDFEQIRHDFLPYAYKDNEGREWVFSSDYMKYDRNVWICVSDPANASIPAFNAAPAPAPWQPGEEFVALESMGGLSLPVLIIVLVVALAAVTAILIRIFWKKPHRETE